MRIILNRTLKLAKGLRWSPLTVLLFLTPGCCNRPESQQTTAPTAADAGRSGSVTDEGVASARVRVAHCPQWR